MIGLAGLAAVVGAGTVLTNVQAAPDSALTAGPGTGTTLRTDEPPVAVELSPAAGKNSPRASGAAALASPSESPSKDLNERLSDARSANKRLGTEPRHANPTANVDTSKIEVVRTGKTGDMLEVYSSPQDLSGHHALAWVRDGKRYRAATCTQTITLSPATPPRKRPTLLICWRTSAEKSAYTIAVDFDEKPSKRKSVRALEKAWAAIR